MCRSVSSCIHLADYLDSGEGNIQSEAEGEGLGREAEAMSVWGSC